MIKLSEKAIIQELAYLADSLQEEALQEQRMFDIGDFLEEANTFLETQVLTEEEYNKITDRLKIGLFK